MARPHPVLVSLAADRDPGTVPDDERVLSSAIEHGMHGLLWSWVEDEFPTCSWRHALLDADLATRSWHRRLWSTLCAARARLAELGIEVATVKGVTTEARWYRRTGERPCWDVDLWVAPDARGRAREIVDALQPDHPLRSEIDELVRDGCLPAVTLDVDGASVDVHFDLFKLGFPLRQDTLLWERTQHYELPDGATIRVPDAELAVVHLLLHLNKDSFMRLLGFADVARILRDDELDWAFVERFVGTEGLDVLVPRALAAVTAELGLAGPSLATRPGPRAEVWRRVWPEPSMLRGKAGNTRSRRQDWMPFLVRGRFADALRWWWQVVFPPASTVAVQYRDLRGPYLWQLMRGRVRTARERRAAMRARDRRASSDGPPAPSRN
jgi:Uncharacterised nucleotidyltransferase